VILGGSYKLPENSFENAWSRCSSKLDGEVVSTELKSLVRQVHAEVVRQPSNLPALKRALDALLAFLSSPVGRTHANCTALDLFFCLDDAWLSEGWAHLPVEFANVLADISGALHDAIKVPKVAKNFDSLPEQLLERVRNIKLK